MQVKSNSSSSNASSTNRASTGSSAANQSRSGNNGQSRSTTASTSRLEKNPQERVRISSEAREEESTRTSGLLSALSSAFEVDSADTDTTTSSGDTSSQLPPDTQNDVIFTPNRDDFGDTVFDAPHDIHFGTVEEGQAFLDMFQ